jgi:hypothetical protein
MLSDTDMDELIFISGADPGGAHPARSPPKIEKNMIFLA